MYSAEKYLGANRLGIFNDEFCENAFVIATGEKVFARINFIDGNWCVWFYTKHLQKNFDKLRDALSSVDEEFLALMKE